MSGLDGQPKQLWLMTKDIQPRRKRMSCWGGMVGHCYPFWKGQCVHVLQTTTRGPAATPSKINIEPENDGLEDDFPLPGVYSQVPC